jgi:hypothetical protein
MSNRRADPKADAAKMSTLSIVWAVVAGVAYLGLIFDTLQVLKQQGLAPDPTGFVDTGLLHQQAGKLSSVPPALFNIALTAIPIVALVVLGLGVAARARPALTVVAALLIVAGLVGLASAAVLFIDIIATPSTGSGFLLALGTIVGVAILLRLERYMRRLYRRNPAVASLLLAFLVVIYLVLSINANIALIVLKEVDIWLALIAFAFALYSGIRLVRIAQRAG